MKHLLLDTHAWAWSMTGDPRLSAKAKSALKGAENVFISPISLFEIGQKVRIGKWPEMEPLLGRLLGLVEEQGGKYARLTPGIFLEAAVQDWSHRDLFDRILGLTAIDMGLVMISADAVFDDLAGQVGWRGRVW
ncbi:twitching motility protein PilT [Agrobacterium tumefaciens]|uniref:Twitching motility protein PilT n=1 Tax=Agrobacterium tumefaciens TaxID=358 RepID=A0A0D0J341_AGRTU|nr:twitching motility protein PilT [Agrobacterium tumefaciens]